eukprot:173139-Amphidinium_carterae.1
MPQPPPQCRTHSRTPRGSALSAAELSEGAQGVDAHHRRRLRLSGQVSTATSSTCQPMHLRDPIEQFSTPPMPSDPIEDFSPPPEPPNATDASPCLPCAATILDYYGSSPASPAASAITVLNVSTVAESSSDDEKPLLALLTKHSGAFSLQPLWFQCMCLSLLCPSTWPALLQTWLITSTLHVTLRMLRRFWHLPQLFSSCLLMHTFIPRHQPQIALRGQRIGEATHPGPPKHTRAPPSTAC